MDQTILRYCVAGAVIFLMAWMIAFGVILRLRGVNPNAVSEKNTNWLQRFLIAGAVLLDLYLVLRAPFPAFDRWLGAHPAPFPEFAMAVMVIGGVIILASQFGMGRSWRVGVPGEMHHVDALVTGGLHRFSRNPVYLGVMIFLFGAAAAAPGLLTLFALIASFVGLTIIIRQEETYLHKRFGDHYTDYARRVRRWI